MRILHVIPSLAVRYGGPPKAAVEMCEELARRGERVAIYTTDLDGSGRLDVPIGRPIFHESGLETRYYRAYPHGSYTFSLPLAAALRDSIAAFDIVHIHSLYRFSSTIAAFYARRARVPYIVRPHGTLDPYMFSRHRLRKWPYELLFERRNLECAAAVHFTAAEEMKLAQTLGLAFRGVIAPLGVAVPHGRRPGPEALNSRWPATRGKKTLLYLGRLTLKKGLDLLAKAYGAISRERDDVHLLIAGPDDEGYGARVREWLRAERVLNRTTFTGMLLGEHKSIVLGGADIFVLPSFSENFGIAAVEAMAAGLPIVISNRVNIWREVALAGAGIAVNCDVADLKRALLEVLDNRALRQEMGQAGRRLASESFSWPSAVDKLMAVYHDIVTRQVNGRSVSGSKSFVARQPGEA